MKIPCGKVVLAVVISLAASGPLLAQSDFGAISGYVNDPTGAAIPNAQIAVRNQSGLVRQATTNQVGFYSVTNLPPGFYTMTAESPGFEKYESKQNKLDPTAQLELDATLKVGASTQTVEVTAAAAVLQTESASVQKLVTRQQMDSLELNGRNPVLLSLLSPGVRGGNLASLNFAFSSGPSNINGSRTPENLITYDGAPATRTRSNGTSLGSADEDSTEEVQVLGADYMAEYGRTSGGQIRIVSKSGGPEFHGAAYEYVRNTSLNANTWTRNSSPATAFTAPNHYNDFGYNIGGPFYIPKHFNTNKSKVFWYWGEEWTRNYFTDSSQLTVPSLLMRQGNFRELLDPNNIYVTRKDSKGNKIPVWVADPQSLSASLCGKETVDGDPTTVSSAGCFPGNITPSVEPVGGGSITSPNGLGILSAYPMPNLTTPIGGNKNWFFNATHPQRQRKDTLAVDVNLTDNQRLRYRREYYAFFEYQPLDGGTNETPKFFNRPNFTNSFDYTWVISPTKVNEVLLTLSHDRVLIPVDAAHFLDRTTVGLNYPYIFPGTEKEIPTRIPTVNMTNFSTLSGGPYPSHSAGPIADVSDSFTWTRGNHTLKFGGLYEWQGENDNDEINVQACPTCTNNQNGQFSFTDSESGGTGAAVANAAIGLFNTYSEIGHRAYTIFRGNMWEGFAQDSWSATRKLHLDYGVRYTVIVPYHADWGNMITFDPAFYDPNNAVTVDPATGLITGRPTIDQLYNGMVIPGNSFPSSANGRVPADILSTYNFLHKGLPNHYSDIQWGDIQPRLGIAYSFNDKTVLRAGAGRFITRLGVSDSIFLGGNPPFQPNASVSLGCVDNPKGSSATCTRPDGGTSSVPLVVTTQSLAFKNPEAWGWNVTLERQMPWQSFLSVGYVGRRGLHLQREADINQPTLAVVSANPGVNINALRPYKGFGSIRETDNVASSRYNSLQVAWNRRAARGLMYGLTYTLSKSMDDGSNQRDVVPDTYDAHFLRGPSEFDARHILTAYYLYQLPFFQNRTGAVREALGGWQISGLLQFQSGTPCSVAGGSDYAGVGLDSNFGCGVNGQYWAVNGTPKIIGKFAANGSKDPNQWFAITKNDGSPIFTKPPAGTFNTQRVRDLIYQPGFNNWNFGLFKSFPISEGKGLQFRAEAFNFLNHPNLGGASGGGVDFNPTSSTFGKVTTKGGERNVQLSLRFYF